MAGARTVGFLNVLLNLNSQGFATGAGKAKREAKGLEGQLTKLRAAAGGLAAGFLTGVSVQAIVDLTKRSLDYAASLGETAQQLGVTAKFMQEFRYAATQAGASVEGADNALSKLSLSIGKAASGTKASVAAFRSLGVEVRDANGNVRDSGAIYEDVAEAISKLPSAAERAAAAAQIFGKGFKEILPLLEEGQKGFKDYAQAAQELGIVLSDGDIANADKAADKIDTLNKVLEVKISKFTSENAAAITELADAMLKLASAAIKALQSGQNFGRFLQTVDWDKGVFQGIGSAISYANLTDEERLKAFPKLRGVLKGAGKPTPDAASSFKTAKPLSTALNRPSAPIFQRLPSAAPFMRNPGAQIRNGLTRYFMSPDEIEDFGDQAEKAVEAVTKPFQMVPMKMGRPFFAARTGVLKTMEELRADLEQETQSILESLFPEEYEAQALKDQIAKLDEALASELIDEKRWFAARGRLLIQLQKLEDEVIKAEAEISQIDLQASIDKDIEAISADIDKVLGGQVEQTTAQVVRNFAEMADGVVNNLRSLGRSIKDGDFIGIILGVLDLLDRFGITKSRGGDFGGFGRGGFGGGGFPGIPGFATGGSFEVGGRAGIDKNLVMFRATKGEMVNISRPGMRDMGPGGGTKVFDLRGAVVTQDLLNQVNSMVASGEARATKGGAELATRGAAYANRRRLG